MRAGTWESKLRAISFEAFLWLSVLGFGVALFALAPWTQRDRLRLVSRRWQRVVLWGLRRICLIDHRVRGAAHLKQGGPLVVVSNHQSSWETIALGCLLPLPQTWVLKRELLTIPVFGRALRLFRPIAIDRADKRMAMRTLLDVGAERLQAGHCIVIFPEGTRVEPGQYRRFGKGAALLATRTGVPVLPIAHNAGLFWPRRITDKRPGTIDVVVGTPIQPEALEAGALNRRIEHWVRRTLERLPSERSEV